MLLSCKEDTVIDLTNFKFVGHNGANGIITVIKEKSSILSLFKGTEKLQFEHKKRYSGLVPDINFEFQFE